MAESLPDRDVLTLGGMTYWLCEQCVAYIWDLADHCPDCGAAKEDD